MKLFIGSNLAFLRKSQNLTQSQLADVLGIKRTIIANTEAGNSIPEIQRLLQIAGHFNVVLDDLLRTNLSKVGNQQRKSHINEVSEKQPPFIIELNPEAKVNTFVSDQKASAGFGRLIESPKLIEQLPAITLPNAPHGLNVAFQITGDSMHPTVRHLDYVAGNQIGDVKDIRNGYTYVLVDKDDGIIYKRIYKERAGIRIVSDNPDYPPYMRETDSILAYFKAFCRLSFDFRPYHDDIRRDIQQLQKDVDWLKGKVK